MFGTSFPFPLTSRNLRKFLGKGPQFDYLSMMAERNFAIDKFDFNVKALDTTNQWTVAAGAGATTWAVRGEAGGWIRGTTGTTAATSGLQISIPTSYWTGTSKCFMAILLKLSDISEIRVETGFANALPSVNTVLVSSLGSAALNTATSAALAVYDHTGTTTTTGLYTAGSSASAAAIATTTNRPVNNTPLFIAVDVSGTAVRLWVGDGDAPLAIAPAGITAADALLPVVSIKSSDTSSSTVDIDTVWVGSGRLG